MAQGLQVWDSSGKIQLDTSTNTSTIVKIIEITEANKPVTYTNSIFNEDNFFYLISPFGRFFNYHVKVTLSGSTVRIVSESKQVGDVTVVLGVY